MQMFFPLLCLTPGGKNLMWSLVLVSNHSTDGSQGNPWKHLIRGCVYGLGNL